ncbi:hypothetical protein [Cryobacterium sp. Hh7]|uniref:hypothetical protein n=1 Tax=Cryobacterium sp. Hh7 TaxID=1259159 RepID=UPI0018E07C13
MPGNDAVIDLGGPFVEERAGESRAPRGAAAPRQSSAPARAQVTGHDPGQAVVLRRIQCLVVALVNDVHRGLAGVVDAQLVADLAWAPLLFQQLLDRIAQGSARSDLALGMRRFTALSYAHRPGGAASLTAFSLDLAAEHADCVPSATFYPEEGVLEQV